MSLEVHNHSYRQASVWNNVMALVITAGIIAGCWAIYKPVAKSFETAPVAVADSTVKVINKDGWGSGVVIDGGYVLTANHVVEGAKSISIKTSTGVTLEATVLWANDAYDVALLKLPPSASVASSPLACVTPKLGDHIHARGNPADIEFLTTDGTVAGASRQLGPWLTIVPVAMPVIPGMSGGPTFDDDGNVVGINVGAQVLPMGLGGSLTGIGMIVPASAVCILLDRT